MISFLFDNEQLKVSAFLEEVAEEHEDTPLLYPQVCVDGGVASCASQVLVFSVGYVLPSAVVPILLRQTKINEEQLAIKENTQVKNQCAH